MVGQAGWRWGDGRWDGKRSLGFTLGGNPGGCGGAEVAVLSPYASPPVPVNGLDRQDGGEWKGAYQLTRWSN